MGWQRRCQCHPVWETEVKLQQSKRPSTDPGFWGCFLVVDTHWLDNTRVTYKPCTGTGYFSPCSSKSKAGHGRAVLSVCGCCWVWFQTFWSRHVSPPGEGTGLTKPHRGQLALLFLPKLQALGSLLPVRGGSPGPPGSRRGDTTPWRYNDHGPSPSYRPTTAQSSRATLRQRHPALGHSPSLLITAGSLLHAHTFPSNSISKGRTCRSPEPPYWPAATPISLQSPFDALQPSLGLGVGEVTALLSAADAQKAPAADLGAGTGRRRTVAVGLA